MNKIFGVVVLNYNDYATTKHFIDNVKNFNNDIQFVVVDNCSTNNSFDIISDYIEGLSNVDIIKAPKNGGYAYGNNFGMRYLIDKYSVKYLMVANPDTVITEDIFSEAMELLGATDFTLLSPIMKKTDGSIADLPYWDIPTYWDDICRCFYILRRLNKKNYHIDFNERIQQVEAVPGSLWIIRADKMQEIGYLDENTFLYCEESILARKLKDKNFKSGLMTRVSYIHAHSVSIKSVLSEIRMVHLMGQSILYYERTYNKISKLRVSVLKLAIKVWAFERRIVVGALNGKR